MNATEPAPDPWDVLDSARGYDYRIECTAPSGRLVTYDDMSHLVHGQWLEYRPADEYVGMVPDGHVRLMIETCWPDVELVEP